MAGSIINWCKDCGYMTDHKGGKCQRCKRTGPFLDAFDRPSQQPGYVNLNFNTLLEDGPLKEYEDTKVTGGRVYTTTRSKSAYR